MTSPREEMKKHWESVCSRATNRELRELLSLHEQDPLRIFEGPRGKCIRDEIAARESWSVREKVDIIVDRIRGRS